MNSQIDILHSKAMAIADDAFIARRRGNAKQAKQLSSEAFIFERDAALLLREQFEIEPTRSVLFRSAGWLAFNAEQYEQAQEMINYGLQGQPPFEIREELGELFQELQKPKYFKSFVEQNKLEAGSSLTNNPFDICEIENSSNALSHLGKNNYSCFERLIDRYGIYVFQDKCTKEILYIGEAHSQDLKVRIIQNYTEKNTGGNFRDNWCNTENKSFNDFKYFLENCIIKIISINTNPKYLILAIESILISVLQPKYNR